MRWLTRSNRPPLTARVVRPLLVALLATVPFVLFVQQQLREVHANNYSGFLMISRQGFDVNPLVRDDRGLRERLRLLDNGGYDGQFAYFIAFDPLMRRFRDAPAHYRDVVDNVTYRYGRVGFSLLTRALSMGDSSRFPRMMVWLTLAGVFGTAWMAGAFAQSLGRSPAWGALVVLIPGFWRSVQSALPESLAAATLVAALLLVRRQRIVAASLLFASSLLIRETGVMVVLLSGAALYLSGQKRSALVLVVLAVLPTALWRLYVEWRIFPVLGLHALTDYPGDLAVPMAGIVDTWRAVAAGDYFGGNHVLARAAIAFSSLLVCGLALAVCLAAVQPTALSIAAVVYGVMAVSLNYNMIWVHVGNAQRGTYELFVLLLLTATTMGKMPAWGRWSTGIFWTAAAAYVLFGGLEAEALRLVLLPNS